MHRLQSKFLENELVDIVGRENVLTNPSDLLYYGVDYMWIPRMYLDRGLVPPTPDLVVLPGSSHEVSQIVKLGNQYRVPIIPWGGGSGSQGGVMPVYGGITMDLKRLNKLVSIDRESQTVTAQAGMGLFWLQQYIYLLPISLPHFPPGGKKQAIMLPGIICYLPL